MASFHDNLLPSAPKSPDEISPTFCALPWIHFNTTTGNLFRYCCLMPKPALDDNGKPFTLEKSGLADVWNGTEIRGIRTAMLRGEKVEACQKCYYDEEMGARSLRRDYSETWLEKEPALIAARVAESRANAGVVSSSPAFIELKFGNQCNIKCRMCSPHDSSQVQIEYEKIAAKDEIFDQLWSSRLHVHGNKEVKLSDLGIWYDNKDSWDGILALLPDLRKIHFAGGEPTLHKKFFEFLELCVLRNLNQQIEISFNTNLTLINDRLLELLLKFKSVVIHGSVDGFGAVQEYIRFPTKWPVIEENIKKIAAIGGSVTLIISPTLQIYNIGSITDLFRFVDSVPNSNPRGFLDITPGVLDHPIYHNFRHLPESYRMAAREKIEAYRAELKACWWKEKLGGISAMLAADFDPGLARHHNRSFLHFTRLLDEQRGQSFEKTFPDLFAAISESLHVPIGPEASV